MFMRVVDIYWYVVPNFAHEQGHFYLSIWYIVAPIGVGGLWLAYFFYNLRQRTLLPVYEPQIPTLLHQGPMATENTKIRSLAESRSRLRTRRPERARNRSVPARTVGGRIFIELVLWGMFRFMAKSDVLFAPSQASPMANAQTLPPALNARSVLQNNPGGGCRDFPGAATASG